MTSPTIPPETPSPTPAPTNVARLWSLRARTPAWLSSNPGLALTLAYVAASVIGLLYHFLFFRRFGINVLEFSETSDFLMVVVREPLTVAMALSGVLVYLGYAWLVSNVTNLIYKLWPRFIPTEEKRLKTEAQMRALIPVMQVAFISVYAFLFVQLYSLRQAGIVRESPRTWVTLDYKTDAPTRHGATTIRGVLLGTTSRFVFLYLPDTKESEAVPFDAIARLNWDARTRRERSADEKNSKSKTKTEPATPPAATAGDSARPVEAPKSP